MCFFVKRAAGGERDPISQPWKRLSIPAELAVCGRPARERKVEGKCTEEIGPLRMGPYPAKWHHVSASGATLLALTLYRTRGTSLGDIATYLNDIFRCQLQELLAPSRRHWKEGFIVRSWIRINRSLIFSPPYEAHKLL
jgi:hypothetical protein